MKEILQETFTRDDTFNMHSAHLCPIIIRLECSFIIRLKKSYFKQILLIEQFLILVVQSSVVKFNILTLLKVLTCLELISEQNKKKSRYCT